MRQYLPPDGVWDRVEYEVNTLLNGRNNEQLETIAKLALDLGKMLSDAPYPPSDVYFVLGIMDEINNRAADALAKK